VSFLLHCAFRETKPLPFSSPIV